LLGNIREFRAIRRRAAGLSPNPAAVEESQPRKLEELLVFHEERALLWKERLERREIDDRWIDLDLAEVRVHGDVEGVLPQAVSEVHADLIAKVGAIEKRVARRLRGGTGTRQKVRLKLDSSGVVGKLEPRQTPERAYPSVLDPRFQGEERALIPGEATPTEVHPPSLGSLESLVQDLGERDSNFGTPPR
jgi:hypothetical protein